MSDTEDAHVQLETLRAAQQQAEAVARAADRRYEESDLTDEAAAQEAGAAWATVNKLGERILRLHKEMARERYRRAPDDL